MFIDARSLTADTTFDTDVCIVGAGAAGITLALELSGERLGVCLLESGGFRFHAATQRLASGETRGHDPSPLHTTRQRVFGGTTDLWTGWCRPFDALDFEAREWVPHSGWPFGRPELGRFYERAQMLCQLESRSYDPDLWQSRDHPALPITGGRVITKMFQLSPPTRFGERYRHRFRHAKNIRTLTHANVLEIETDETGGHVRRVRVATLNGVRFWVAARIFVLAAGGIENPRLLLSSSRVHKEGLGNGNGLVGRFFMDHPYLDSAEFRPTDRRPPLGLYAIHRLGDASTAGRVAGSLALAPEVLREEGLVSCVFVVPPVHKMWAEFRSESTQSFIHLMSALSRRSLVDSPSRHALNVLRDPGPVLLTGWRKFRRTAPQGKLLIRCFIEAAPNPESRVSLGDERDSLGMRVPRVDWRLTALDRRSLVRAHEVLAEDLRRSGIGELTSRFDAAGTVWPESLIGGRHHMGTTRMHADSMRGVVDPNCKVHEVSNLFVAGSSVFPTAGSANPTLTIVALAARLGEHLKRMMSR